MKSSYVVRTNSFDLWKHEIYCTRLAPMFAGCIMYDDAPVQILITANIRYARCFEKYLYRGQSSMWGVA